MPSKQLLLLAILSCCLMSIVSKKSSAVDVENKAANDGKSEAVNYMAGMVPRITQEEYEKHYAHLVYTGIHTENDTLDLCQDGNDVIDCTRGGCSASMISHRDQLYLLTAAHCLQWAYNVTNYDFCIRPGIAGDFDVEKQCFRNLAVTKDDQKLMPLNDNNNEAVALLPPNINLTKGAIEGYITNDITIVRLAAETEAYKILKAEVKKPIVFPESEQEYLKAMENSFPNPGDQLFSAGYGYGHENDNEPAILRGRNDWIAVDPTIDQCPVFDIIKDYYKMKRVLLIRNGPSHYISSGDSGSPAQKNVNGEPVHLPVAIVHGLTTPFAGPEDPTPEIDCEVFVTLDQHHEWIYDVLGFKGSKKEPETNEKCYSQFTVLVAVLCTAILFTVIVCVCACVIKFRNKN